MTRTISLMGEMQYGKPPAPSVGNGVGRIQRGFNANHANPRGFVLLRHPVWLPAEQFATIRPIREDSCSPRRTPVLPSNATILPTHFPAEPLIDIVH